MNRRSFLKTGIGGALSAAALSAAGQELEKVGPLQEGRNKDTSEIVVIGAGVFGVWTAFYLQELGAKVTLVDAYGPGNSRASSGGETRILRSDYGERLLYTKMNIKAHGLWDRWQKEWGSQLMYPSGRLNLYDAKDIDKVKANIARLQAFGIEGELLNQDELSYRWPQINYEDIPLGMYFPGGAGGSVLMARKACRITGEQFVKNGGELRIAKAVPGIAKGQKLDHVLLNQKDKLSAQQYVFACGPWMSQLFPRIFEERLKVYRRDVLFIGAPAGDPRYSYPNFPIWGFQNEEDKRYYGTPDIYGRGLKVAPWPDNNSIDLDRDERRVNNYEVKRCYEFVAKRFPGLAGQPLLEGRVCQLTFSKDEHFIVDQHPELENVWFVCAGSGHGFKHGPAFGEYTAKRIFNGEQNAEYDEAFRLEKND